MVYTKLTETAMKIAFDAHKDQKDKAGLPYFHHPMHIAEKFEDEKTVAAALLHDVIEDTDMTFEDLKKQNIPDDIIDALKLLTHIKTIPYDNYIKAIKFNDIARRVKIEDLKHNLDTTRLKTTNPNYMADEKIQKRIAKYKKALDYLSH